MNLDRSQQKAIERMNGGDNIFLTGMAGTGKSTVITHYLGQAFGRVDITATTGIAALNLRDQYAARIGVTLPVHTIYRWAGIYLGPKPGQPFASFFNWLLTQQNRPGGGSARRIRNAETLIIDEISMLPGRILDYLDYHCRRVREVDKPFGGIQVIAVGDFLQLPPVVKSGNHDWAFKSQAWKEGNFVPTVLDQIHRQADSTFIDVLNDVRIGKVKGATAEILRQRVARFPKRDMLRLFTHNTQVDTWNNYQLELIENDEPRTFTASAGGPPNEVGFLKKNLVTPEILTLKRGAQVMITANLSNDGELIAVNGAIGTVEEISPETVTVKLNDGTIIFVERYRWIFDPQRRSSGWFEQFPLRLAWAATIHKSQGLSLDSALIDIRATREPGQAYVAISRVRSLPGLSLRGWFKGLWISADAINFHNSFNS